MDPIGIVRLGDENFEFPIMEGTKAERAIDLRTLRSKTGHIAFDEGYGNTGSCESGITFINGEKGILQHRGYPIEQLAEQSTFLETAYLIIYGELPSEVALKAFERNILSNATLDAKMYPIFEGFHQDSHPMAMLSSIINSLCTYHSEYATNNRKLDLEHFDAASSILMSKARTIAAMIYRKKMGLPMMESDSTKSYSEDFLSMLLSKPEVPYVDTCGASEALDLFFLLHADHEQNCSTSTVRMVASSGTNLFASISAGISALWGPSHGGANMAVIEMLEAIHATGDDGTGFIEAAKSGQAKLMGFGHRVYKNYDPRAKILGKSAVSVLEKIGINDPLLDIARRLERAALEDEYFVQRKLYPNVDFYSGIILKAIGIPVDFFTVMFALGRIPGWMANWKEIAENPKSRIHRPRQIYTGYDDRNFVKIDKRP
ncbi:MAG: citrate synthase [Verrucomicrobia bacterium]|jgi:citrate synthase|nr:citrate synthase [Verrucomicrobiota bacterium]